MEEDLVSFNQSRDAIVAEFVQQIDFPNCFQTLGILYRKELLSQPIWRLINTALFTIYFTSVDYKPPEKKPKDEVEGSPEAGQALNDSVEPENKDTLAQNDGDDPDGSLEKKPDEEQKDGGGEGDNVAAPEEEWVPPEVTPFEQEMVAAKAKLRIEFVESWDFQSDFDAILRTRLPLNREPPVEAQKTGETKGTEPDDKKDDGAVKPDGSGDDNKDVEEEKKVNPDDEFIEPYDGTTYEREREKHQGKIQHKRESEQQCD